MKEESMEWGEMQEEMEVCSHAIGGWLRLKECEAEDCTNACGWGQKENKHPSDKNSKNSWAIPMDREDDYGKRARCM
jgi:hypothetical protein